MLKGINQWCFPEGTPLEAVFEKSRRAGFDAVELNVNAPSGVGLTMDTTVKEAENIGALAGRYGLQLRSISTGLLWQHQLGAEDASEREQGRKVVQKQIELAAVLGADTVLIVPGRVSPQMSYDDCYKRSQEEIRRLVPAAEENKIYIGVENVWNKFLLSPLEMARYIDEIGSPYVGAYFDVGNILLYGYPEQWIRILGKRIKKIHVKDFKLSAGNYTGFVPLLSGDVDWLQVRAALQDIGYGDAITAELEPYKHSADQMVFDTARHIDFIIGREPK
jgi:L-ribulose-5-phosphate 3-epimerase